MNSKRLFILLVVLNSLLTASPSWAVFDSAKFNQSSNPLAISRITPTGEDVEAERQIVFQFNQPVVPIGKMERTAAEIPISIQPEVKCEWRWVDTSALACQLRDEDRLKSATRYRVVMEPGIKTEDGRTIAQAIKHEFITQRPRVSYASFNTWKGPGTPQIRVSFNQAVTKASVESSLHIRKPNGQRVALDVLPIGKEQYDYDEQEAEKGEPSTIPDSARAWIVVPKQLLGLDTTHELWVTEGLVSGTGGSEKGIENQVVTNFDTYPEFRFLGVSCPALNGEEVFIAVGDPLNKNNRCNPLRQVALTFSSPVSNATVKQNLLLTPDLAGGRTDYDPWDKVSDHSQLNDSHTKGNTYRVWLPELLKAYETYKVAILNPNTFKDEFGRTLPVAVNTQFATDNRAPNFVFEYEHSVLESGITDSELPMYVTNLQKVAIKYNVLTAQGWSAIQEKVTPLPALKNIAVKMPVGVRQLLNGKSGIVQGHYITTPDTHEGGNEWSNWFFSQVTPYHVQVKLGHYNTLVWVTDFATGKPVADAQVSLYLDNYVAKDKLPDSLATVTTNEDGIAQFDGREKLDPELKHNYVYDPTEQRFFVHVQKGEDFAVLPLDNNYVVEMYQLSSDYSVYSYPRQQYAYIRAWGMTAQGVYKAGDTIQYKLYVRNQGNNKLEPAPKGTYKLEVYDPTGKVVQEVSDIQLSDFGAYQGELTVPKTGAVGWYRFELSADYYTGNTWSPMRVLVSDFTPSSFRVKTNLNGDLFHLGDTITVDTQAMLHAGGAYGDAQTQVVATLSQGYFVPASPVAKGFQFDTYLDEVNDETLFQTESKVNEKGELQTQIPLKDTKVLYGTLHIESAVRDDRGKDVASSSTAVYVGRDRFVGLKTEGWLLNSGKENIINTLVVDERGNPIAGAPVLVTIERQDTKAARVKGAGNAYLTQYETVWVETNRCELAATTEPVACRFTPPNAGVYRLIATIKDTKDREHKTTVNQWATGAGEVVWQMEPGNGLEIVPEQESYKVGETAKYLVKNPFPNATALVTVERLGTIKSWLVTLHNSVEVISIPVEADYTPGFFVSVTVVSPRVDKPIDGEQVDLGKPTFRMGYVKTLVSEPYKELVVDIQTDKPVYKPREQVTVKLHAHAKQSDVKAQPIELAIVVLDESVFDLIQGGRSYFDPYKGFYDLSDLDMSNYSSLMRLVGRQKFEKKGATPGGDGGMGPNLRSLFKFVTYWNPSVPTDAEGNAQVQFTVPDNLTGWRILALAVTPNDRLGLGDANFKVNLPIEVRPALPNQVTAGDTFEAGFTVMNRTDKARELDISLSATGPVQKTAGADKASVTLKLKTEPYKRYNVWLPISTTDVGEIQFTASAGDATDKDGLTQTLHVFPRRSFDTAASYGTTTEASVTESLLFPADIYGNVGKVSVVASPTVISDIKGAFEYMRDYPYACWEQKLSKGTMAAHYTNLKAYLPNDLLWSNADVLPQATLDIAADYQAPNGGMTYYIAQDKYVSPYLSAYTALAFNWLRVSGYNVPAQVENKLHEYLLTMLRKDVMPDFYSQGMASSVRAVALAALAKQGKVVRDDINRYQRSLKEMDLFGKSQFLDAALAIPGTNKVRMEAVNAILSQLNQTGGKITFQETLDDGYNQLLSSSLRTECSILNVLVNYDEVMQGNALVSDIPYKLVRHISQSRKYTGYWENTQENMFCMNALTAYARIYEKDKPAMIVRTFMDDKPMSLAATPTTTDVHFDDVKNPPATFERPITEQDPGRKASVKIEKQGDGRVYYAVRMQYATKEEKSTAVNAGIELNREYHVKRDNKWTLLTSPMELKTGELVRVDLYLSLPAARHFVVVDDPVPGGLEPVNRDLATASTVAADEAEGTYAGGSLWYRFTDWQEYAISFWSFYHQELRHNAAIFYSDYLPPGNYHLSYVAQAIAPGDFVVMPSHSEEMYDPDVYGKSMPAKLKVVRDAAADAGK
ncbi:alpha-2-macroglobulin family protein [Beggiatoa leptomitoformis]|uniref:Large extracellular alpha-helical protein n=1 Tax=Beggiatoa leptomitoformis TaxID=288004 RepID=A0A2N9YBH8_9GAMM|nr:alpha-2-macroglobulin family protein [Beggiatoa leptomitoformis]ALG66830.1 large extracellular alpha-helical protein [Beggiatoa leptomitoformis]AUI67817.1 large extracellular alpha-helical protein [Beggiatoa leptomitoformis]